MATTPRKTFPELQALSAPVVDSDVLAVYRTPGPAKRTTASVLKTYAQTGLGTMATQNANAVAITGGSITGITDLAVADGGTGASDASGARTNLGLVIGTNVQAYNLNLASLSGLTLAADQMLYATGANTLAQSPITSFGRSLVDDADASAARTTLGVVIGTNVQAYDADLQAIAALTSAADKMPYATGAQTWALADLTAAGRALLDDVDASAQRTTLAAVGSVELAATGGSAQVGFLQAGTGAINRTLQSKTRDLVNLLDFIPSAERAAIIANTSTYNATAEVQAAIDATPLNGFLHFPNGGRVQIQGQININRRINLIGNGCRWIGQFGADVTSDFLSINVQDTDNLDCRNMQISGFNTFGFFGGGRHTIRVQATSPGVANIGLKNFNNVIGTLSTSTGYAISLESVGVHINEIYGNQIENGIYLACADRTVIRENNIFGIKPAVTCDLISGAFRTAILNNCLTARDGALLVTNGSQIDFVGNQIEQFASYGANASTRQASIAVNGTTYGSRGLRIIGNNFGGGSNQRVPISLVSNCEGAIIDENVFNAGSTGLDIEILATSVKSTRIGRGNSFRGTRAGADPAWPLAINDAGEGTYNVWKDAASLALQNSWTGSASFRYIKTLDDLIVSEGAFVAGTNGGGTIVGTFPVGFRPAATMLWGGVNDIASTASTLVVQSGGVFTVQYIQFASSNYMAPLPIRGNAVYSPGV